MTLFDSIVIVIFLILLSFIIGVIVQRIEKNEIDRRNKRLYKTVSMNIIPKSKYNGGSDSDDPVIIKNVIIR